MRSSITAAGSASRSSRSSSSITTPISTPPTAFGGKPQRIREIKADFEGGDRRASGEGDAKGRARRRGVERGSGDPARGAALAWARSTRTSVTRRATTPRIFAGYARDPGGGLTARPSNGEPIGLHDLLTSRLWRSLQSFALYDFQTTMFQPVGGMGRIGEAFARQIPNVIRYGAKVTAIQQDETRRRRGVRGPRPRRRCPGGHGGLVRLRVAARRS